jgi:hypothetical protein
MTATESPRPPRSRMRGCLGVGCLVLIGLAVVPPLLLWSMASEGFEVTLGNTPEDWQAVHREHALPGAAAAMAPPSTDPLGGAAGEAAAADDTAGADDVGSGGESIDGAPLPPVPPPPPLADGSLTAPGSPGSAEMAAIPAAGHGRIVLDVTLADLEVVPVDAGRPLRLTAEFDRARYRLDESLEESGADWTYQLRFRSRGMRSWWGNHGRGPQLRLEVPRGAAVSVEGKFGVGESDIELGGLTLDAVELDLGMGSHELSFSAPTVGTTAFVRIDSGMGELDLVRVGNASPRELEIDHGMGELSVDLGGAWRNDSEVELELGMGECQVSMPARSEAGGIVVESDLAMGSRSIDDVAEADVPAGLPKVRIRTSGAMGNLDIR